MNEITETISLDSQVKETSRSKRITSLVIKMLVSAALIYWILKGADFNAIFSSVASADFFLIACSFFLHLIGYLISALRWRILLKEHGADAKISYLIKSYIVSGFFNNILPSTIGGDTVRMYDSYKAGVSKSGAVAVVFVDRFLGLSALIIFAFFSILLLDNLYAHVYYLVLWVAITLLLAIFVIWLIFFPSKKILLLAGKIKIPFSVKLQNTLEKIISSFWSFKGKRVVLLKSLSLSLLLQTNVVFFYFLVSEALGLSIPIYNFFLIIPLSLFVIMLPITINGIGLRENIFFFFLSVFAVTKPDAIAFAWIEYGMLISLGVIGGIIYMFRK